MKLSGHLKSMWAAHKTAKHSGIGSVPADQKLSLDTTPEAYKLKFAEEEKKNRAHFKKQLRGYWRNFRKESVEHPTLPKEIVGQIVEDHLTARHEIQLRHGTLPEYKTAHHFGIGMKDFAVIPVAFLKEGDFRTNGVPYHYDWETIERDGKSFEGKEFYIDHIEKSGTEMGLIDKVYVDMIDGVKWLCALVKVPESPFTQNFLDRIQNGLVRFVSSTHDFIVDPDDPERKVKKIVGKAISSVKEGEVDEAKILGISRHVGQIDKEN